MSSNSIKQHRVPAWPAGHPMEFQHGLLVVQESITLISVLLNHTRLSSSQHQLPQRFSARQLCLEQLQRGNTSELLVNGLAIKAFFVTFRRFLCDMSRPAQFPSINSQADKEKRSVLLRFASLHIHRARFVAVPSARGPTRGWRSRRSSNLRRRGASLALPLPWRRGAFLASS